MRKKRVNKCSCQWRWIQFLHCFRYIFRWPLHFHLKILDINTKSYIGWETVNLGREYAHMWRGDWTTVTVVGSGLSLAKRNPIFNLWLSATFYIEKNAKQVVIYQYIGATGHILFDTLGVCLWFYSYIISTKISTENKINRSEKKNKRREKV